MENTFEFDQQPMFMKNVKVDDIGNLCLEGWTDDGYYFYIVTRTVMGETTIFSWGPVIPDITDLVPNGYTMQVKKLPYKEPKIISEVSSWLNAPKGKLGKITNAQIADINDAVSQILDIGSIIHSI